MNKKKIAILSLIALILVFGAWKLLSPKTAATSYQTSTVQKDTLITSVSASGTVVSGGAQSISTSATGIVAGVYVKEGDQVAAGQKIADINLDQDSQSRMASAWSSYLSAKNQLDSANNNYNSLQATAFQTNQKLMNDAVMRGLATDDPTYIQENATWLQAENNYKNQASIVSAAQASLSNAWYSYQQISPAIYAPISGKITNLALAKGLALVNSSSTATAQKVVSITPADSHIQASVNVSEVDSFHIKSGQKVTLTLDSLTGKTFTGKVLVINTNGSVSSGVTTYPVAIVFDTDVPNIYTNMAVTAEIITNIKPDVILVPTSAIQTSNGESTVRILKNKQPQSVTVELGDANSTDTEITSGLNVGDVVITSSTSSTVKTTTGTTAASPFSGLGGGTRTFVGGR